MGILLDFINNIKWKAQDIIWSVQDKYTLWKELKDVDKELNQIEEIEVKPKKRAKKAKKNKRK